MRLSRAFTLLFCAAGALGACEHSPTPPPNVGPGKPKFFVSCSGKTAALHKTGGSHATGPIANPDTATATVGGEIQIRPTFNDKGLSLSTSVTTFPTYGTDTYINYILYYLAPPCTGVDTVAYILQDSSGPADTSYIIVTVTNVALSTQDTVIPRITSESTRVIAVRGGVHGSPGWTNARAAGILGSSHGTVTLRGDTLIHVANASFVGMDSVRILVDADVNAYTAQDTVLFRFDVRPRGSPPGPYDATTISSPPGSVLDTTSVYSAFRVNRSAELSSDGRVAGTLRLVDGTTHAFVWTTGTLRDLGTYQGFSTVGTGVNSSGDVVGYSRDSTGNFVGLLWHSDGRIDKLPMERPIAINDSGAVLAFDNSASVYWRNGTATRISGTPLFLTPGGAVWSCYPSLYPVCHLTAPTGATTPFYTHGIDIYTFNNAGDFFARIGTGCCWAEYFYADVPDHGSALTLSVDSLYPERLPYGARLAWSAAAMNSQRNVLAGTTGGPVLTTPAGAFFIDQYVRNSAGPLTRLIDINDRGQILGWRLGDLVLLTPASGVP